MASSKSKRGRQTGAEHHRPIAGAYRADESVIDFANFPEGATEGRECPGDSWEGVFPAKGAAV